MWSIPYPSRIPPHKVVSQPNIELFAYRSCPLTLLLLLL